MQSNSCIFTTAELFLGGWGLFSHIYIKGEEITVCGDSDCINHEAWLGVSLPVDAHMCRLPRRNVWQVLSCLTLLHTLQNGVQIYDCTRTDNQTQAMESAKTFSFISPTFYSFKSVICNDLLSLMYCPTSDLAMIHPRSS